MLNEEVKTYLLPKVFNAAVRAGAAIMKIYKHCDNYDIAIKGDNTPITVADRAAHNVIREYLGSTRIPVLSEEGREMRYEERRNWELFWLVDPLDGTVEFIKGNNEFTVNIALMENNICIASVVYVPFLQKIYFASRGEGSFLREHIIPDEEAEYSYAEVMKDSIQLPLVAPPHTHLQVAVSRSHQTEETRQHIAKLRERHPDLEIIEQGSSYKFCLLAEGVVDYYARTTHTYEWDTAAGELILAEAGGQTRSLPDHEAFTYNKEDLHNPWFVCRSKNCPQ
ncbi:MAG: 3'(2'),5'-bisphosphate nucleotidase CysQ [Alistipes sp.]